MPAMMELDARLTKIKEHIDSRSYTVMLLGPGSVGCYLLNYLLSSGDDAMKCVIVGRNAEKMEADTNIVKVAAMLRRQYRSQVVLETGVDFDDPSRLSDCIAKHQPDFIVNTSRVYSGLKYGSISWSHIRAYGIWSPLAIKYIRNITRAAQMAESHALIINTSYSDAVNPWLRSAGLPFPDLGSGNLNHLIPRIQMAAGKLCGIEDVWNIEAVYATSHFHDVVISKEGQTEGVEQLLALSYQGRELEVSQKDLFALCSIPMPSDAKRNQMNASSNYDIIHSVLEAARLGTKYRLHTPGPLGELGGYPVCIDGENGGLRLSIDDSRFSIDAMRSKNKESIYLDGIEKIEKGVLFYTDELVEKTEREFRAALPKSVAIDEVDDVARFLIEKIIDPFRK